MPVSLNNIAWQSLGPVNLPAVGYGNDAATGAPMRISGVVHTVRFQPDNPAVMYITSGYGLGGQILSSGGAYKSTDGGKTWRALNNGLTDPIVNDTLIDPTNSSVVMAGTYTGGIYRSADAGASWTLVKATHQVTQLAATNRAMYATSSDGVLVSTDHGLTWNVSLGLKAGVAPNAVVVSGTAMYAGYADGQFFSLEAGQWVTRASLPVSAPVQAIAVDPATPSTIFTTVNTGIANPLFLSRDSGASWTRLPIPAGLGAVQGLAYSKVTPHLAYIVGGGQLVTTTDNGATMKPGAGRGDQRSIVTMPDGKGGEDCYMPGDQGLMVISNCADPAHITTQRNLTHDLALSIPPGLAVGAAGKTMLIAVQDYTGAASYDSGASWATLSSRPYENIQMGIMQWEDGFVAFNSVKPNYCYALQWDGQWSYSEDSCNHFTLTKIAATTPPVGVAHAIANDFRDPSKVYAAVWNEGVMRSTNYGKTMQPTGWALRGVNGVYVDPNDGNRIFVTTQDAASRQNLLRSTDAGKTWTTLFSSPVSVIPLAVDIALSPSIGVPGVIVVGYASSSTRLSLIRSTDGGAHFSAPVTFPTAQDAMQLVSISLGFNPLNPSVVAAASAAGLVASADAGVSWRHIDGEVFPRIYQSVAWSDGYLYATVLGKGVVKTTTRLK